MKTWLVKFNSGVRMTVKANDYFGAKGKVDGYIKSCRNKPTLFSISLVE